MLAHLPEKHAAVSCGAIELTEQKEEIEKVH